MTFMNLIFPSGERIEVNSTYRYFGDNRRADMPSAASSRPFSRDGCRGDKEQNRCLSRRESVVDLINNNNLAVSRVSQH